MKLARDLLSSFELPGVQPKLTGRGARPVDVKENGIGG
jgi:hypothetical protein